jgi:hypothetical protein
MIEMSAALNRKRKSAKFGGIKPRTSRKSEPIGLSSDAGGAPKVYRIAPKLTKKRLSRIPAPQSERILQRFIAGQGIREISREEGRARQTVTKIVRPEKVQAYVQAMRERFYGLGGDALAAVQQALRHQKDAQLAYRLLMDIGVVPTAEQRFFFATQAAGAAMGPGGQQFSPTALMLAQAIVDKCETFDMPLPAALAAEVQRNLEGNPDDDDEEE